MFLHSKSVFCFKAFEVCFSFPRWSLLSESVTINQTANCGATDVQVEFEPIQLNNNVKVCCDTVNVYEGAALCCPNQGIPRQDPLHSQPF